jgi:hypothetical protein
MSETFLLNLMRVAQEVTKAERAFAVDTGLTVLGTINVAPEHIEAAYLKGIKKALGDGEPVITDNYTMSIDPTRAPKTNQSYPELRAVVIIPIVDLGAICLDQKLRGGIITKEKVDRLMRLAVDVIRHQQTEMSEAELNKRYKELS